MLYNAYNYKLSGNTKSRKEALSYLNIMVVGSVGSGKTAFVRTFCETLKHSIIPGSFKESKPMVLKDPLRSTEELYTVSMQVEEHGQRTALSITDTPGFRNGATAEHQLRFIAKYIDYQFERTLAEENKVKRDAKASDTHVHCCLYFLDNKSINGLNDVDKYLLKMLSSRVNIIPMIGKADTLTMAQRDQLKAVFRKEVFDILQIPVYGCIDVEQDNSPSAEPAKQHTNSHQMNVMLDILQECVDEDNDQDAASMIDYLQTMPFTVVAYEEDPETGRPMNFMSKAQSMSFGSMVNLQQGIPFGSMASLSLDSSEDEDMVQQSPTPLSRKGSRRMTVSDSTILGRRYPWAVVECCNPSHCDFAFLKHSLLNTHRDMLRIDTFERFYEQYRTEKLMNHKVTKMINFGPKPIKNLY